MLALSLCAALVAGCSGESDEDEDENRTASDPTCVSGTRWTGGSEESALMHPGGACISCHEQQGEGPKLSVAGTVFAASDEKLDCFGEANVQVAIVGDDGQSLTLDTNSAGNFSYEEALTSTRCSQR